MYGLPQDILSIVYTYDDTFRKIFSNKVMKELQSKSTKSLNTFVIKELNTLFSKKYQFLWSKENSFSQRYFILYKFSDKQMNQKIRGTSVVVQCMAINLIEHGGFESTLYHLEDDDTDSYNDSIFTLTEDEWDDDSELEDSDTSSISSWSDSFTEE